MLYKLRSYNTVYNRPKSNSQELFLSVFCIFSFPKFEKEIQVTSSTGVLILYTI